MVDDLPGCVYTLIGAGPPGYRDGAGSSAMFAAPRFLSVDDGGAVYVADSENHVIRRIDTVGAVTTVAGRGVCGFQDGPVDQALLCYPQDVRVAADGSLYVADQGNARIRRVADASVTTLAGSGGFGFLDGDAGSATFGAGSIWGIFPEPNGNVLIADRFNSKIREYVAATNIVTTVAGTGTSGFNDGVAGAPPDGGGAQLNWPSDVLLWNGELIISEVNRIRLLPLDGGRSSTLAGSTDGTWGYVEGSGPVARFFHPMQMRVLPGGGTLVVADSDNSKLRNIVLNTGFTSLLLGNQGGFQNGPLGTGITSAPTGLALLSSSAAVFTDANNRLRQVGLQTPNTVADFAGGPVQAYGQNGELVHPKSAHSLPDGGWIWLEPNDGNVRMTLADGGISLAASFPPLSPGDLRVGPDGLVYVADTFDQVIRVIDPRVPLVSTSVAGNGTKGLRDGDAGDAMFSAPGYLGFGTLASGGPALYVSDVGNGAIRQIDLSRGRVTTIWGPHLTELDGGPVTLGPVVGDAQGNVYFVDETPPARFVELAPNGGIWSAIGQLPASSEIVAIDLVSPGRLVGVIAQVVVEANFTDGGVRQIFHAKVTGWQDGDSNTGALSNLTGVEVAPHALIVTDSASGRIKRLWGLPPP